MKARLQSWQKQHFRILTTILLQCQAAMPDERGLMPWQNAVVS